MGEEDRRAELISTFIKVFCRYGIDKTTTKKLAEEANLSEAGLYVYFKNKEDILLKCVEWHVRCVKSDIDRMMRGFCFMPEAFIRAVYVYTKSMLHQNRFIFQVLTHPHYSEITKNLRYVMFNSVKETAAEKLKAHMSRETAIAVTLLLNSTLNNYILTQDEDGFETQVRFLLKIFQNE